MKKRGVRTLSFVLLFAMLVLLVPPSPVAAAQEETSLRGAWIATTLNIDFPVKGSTVEEQKALLIKQLDAAKAAGLNAVFFQVRPAADAFYKSSIFPWSEYLTGEQGKAPEPYYDPLAFLIEQAKQRGIEVHAWINPYRITMGSAASPKQDVTKLAANHPARLHPELTVAYPDGRLYFNPGEPAAQKLVVDGVMEIVKNYDIAGIHFDDYFYPYKWVKDANGKTIQAPFDDAAAYKKYGSGYKTVEEWRRTNTYNLVKTVHDEINKVKPEVEFGISPFGVWANSTSMPEGSDTNGGIESYVNQFADTRKWVKDGIIDYIAPQLYWAIGFAACDYTTLLHWWSDVVEGTGVKLYVGHALYKMNDSDQGASWMDPEQIPSQVKLSAASGKVSGNIFYGFSKLMSNESDIVTRLSGLFGQEAGGTYSGKGQELVIGYPKSGITGDYKKLFIIGSADPAFPVTMNGKAVTRTASGHFSVYVSLEPGENVFKFESNGKTVDFVAKRLVEQSSSGNTQSGEVKISSVYPSGEVVLKKGQSVNLSCVAPAGAKVTALVDGAAVVLKAAKSSTKQSTVTYSASYTAPARSGYGKIKLGSPSFVLEYNGKVKTFDSSTTLYVYNADPSLTATVTAAEVIVRSSASSSASRLTNLVKGVTDRVVWESGSYYKLASGGWVLKSQVSTDTKGKPDSVITSVGGKNTGDATNIIFGNKSFVPYTVSYSDSGVTVSFPNTQGKTAFKMVSTNPLFKSITYKQDGSTATYTLAYKTKGGFYGYSVSYSGGKMTFSFKNPLLAAEGDKPLSGIRVLLDAGHGGSDRGAMGPLGVYGANEKDLNLTVTQYAKAALERKGATVIMTRSKDGDMSLDARTAVIAKEDPDLCVSIHHNSVGVTSDSSKPKGLLVLYSETFSSTFASAMEKSMAKSMDRVSQGSKFQGLQMCRVNSAPSILLEMGFISNPTEYELLSSDSMMRSEGQAIADAIEAYVRG